MDFYAAQHAYFSLGQVLSETNPLGKANSYTYDFAGNVLTKTDRNGNVTQNTYGIFGISKTQIGTSVTDYSYNGIGQLMQKKLTSSQKLTDEESYTYDPFGRMTACENQDCSITNPAVVDNGYQLQYSYDKNSNLLGYTLSENQTQKSVVSYQYDQNNRLTKATLDGKIFLYQYDQNGNLLQKQGGGITTQIAYNKANLPVSYQNGTLQSYAYTYALDGNRLTDSETVSQVQKSYQYTNRGELSAETVNGTTTAYTYDSRSNRLTKTGNDTASYLYDLANRLTKETHDTWYEDSSYDDNGNLINVHYQSVPAVEGLPDMISRQFQYNEANQLVSVSKSWSNWKYTYNVNGLRNTKRENTGTPTTFTWNGGNMIREVDTIYDTIYTYGADGVTTIKNAFHDYVYQKNAHGDVVSMTNTLGIALESYTYDAFGNQPSAAADHYRNFRYCGEYTDPETGFVYLRNRYYDTATGRFITEDPVRDGLNWYKYANNNPINFYDPTGTTAGQISGESGYGGIYNTTDYVNDRYGRKWEPSSWGTLEPNMQKFLMNDLEKNANNCTLVALTRVFAYHRDNNQKTNIPDNETLYNDIKEIAEKYGYNNEDGTSPTKINNIINDIFDRYGYEGKGSSIYAWNFNTVKKEIDAGRPVLFNIAFGYYGNHTVSVVGYHEFTRGTGIFKETKKFIKVYDGWTNSNRYIDYSQINIGSFSTVKFN